eukprot:COSAG01_NODE_1458_length_10252_cov_247.726288_12_plen_304_part_00
MAEPRVRVMVPLRAGDGGTAGRRAGSPRQPPHCHGGDGRGRRRGGGRGDLRHVSQTAILLRRRARHSPVTASGGDVHGASIRRPFGAGSAPRKRARPGRPRWRRRRSRLGKHAQSRLAAPTQLTRLCPPAAPPQLASIYAQPPPPLRSSCLCVVRVPCWPPTLCRVVVAVAAGAGGGAAARAGSARGGSGARCAARGAAGQAGGGEAAARGGESFPRVDWVAVPKALRARRVNRRRSRSALARPRSSRRSGRRRRRRAAPPPRRWRRRRRPPRTVGATSVSARAQNNKCMHTVGGQTSSGRVN